MEKIENIRDSQKQKVYNWEEDLPRGAEVRHDQAQAIINYIWESEGLKYPPILHPVPLRGYKVAGKANRSTIWTQPTICTRDLIHEICHSMTAQAHGDSENITHKHGPVFVGMSMKLYEKYMQVAMPVMLFLVNKHKVKYDLTAKPSFLDD